MTNPEDNNQDYQKKYNQERQHVNMLIDKLEKQEKAQKTSQFSQQKLLLYICDICGSENNGKPNKRYVDAPYLLHIKKDQLVNVCPPCLKQVVIISPSDLEKEEDWGI
jgi:hypothetical protein